MLFDHFREFLLYTIGKDNVLNETEVTNLSTASPVHYFGAAGWFIIITSWLFLFYNFFYEGEKTSLIKRMRLYGVRPLQHVCARMIVTLFVTGILGLIAFSAVSHFLAFDLAAEQIWRVTGMMALYSVMLLLILAIIETAVPAAKMRLLIQSGGVLTVLLLSGALIPALYFPLQIQAALPYVFSAEAFHWLAEILLQKRFYADFTPLLLMNAAGFFLLAGLAYIKERTEE
jgi:ABC-2 type transport system permease protein